MGQTDLVQAFDPAQATRSLPMRELTNWASCFVRSSMLDSLTLHNFKSARDLVVPLNSLTVLSGLNGSGKSSVLQAISLVRQSLLLSQSVRLPSLHLRGPLVQLGVADDVISDRAADNTVRIGLKVDGLQTDWVANATVDSDILQVHIDAVLPADP